jgi:AIPR protein
MTRVSRSLSVEVSPAHDDHCKRLKDPTQTDVYHLEAFLPFTEAVKLDRGNANVRPPSSRNRAYRPMVETVETSPDTFHIKNRGITYFCDRFQYDNSKKILTVTLPEVAADDDEPKYGIADGGHTFEVIEETIRRLAELQEKEGWTIPYVRIHFIGGTRSLATTDEEIVEALNTSAQVQQFTLDEYAGKFEELKDALIKAGFPTDLIAFRENEEKEWKVLEVIQRMACFLKERWQLTQPASMYKSKGKALDLYINDNSRGEFRRLYDVINDVVTFPEFIQATLSKGDLVPLRSFGKLRAVTGLKKTWKRPGTPYETNHRMDMAALLPMAAAFRELLVLRGDRYAWRVDPKLVFRNCADKLYNVLNNRSAKIRTTSQLGSDMEYWGACVPIVMREKDRLVDIQEK